MNQPLRTWHRRAVFTLAAFVPAVFVAGVLARKMPAPPNTGLRATGSPPAGLQWNSAVSFRIGDTAAALRESSDGEWIEIEPAADPLLPDLLVYWSGAAPDGDALPAGARMAGALPGRGACRLRLPRPAGRTRGYLLVYSLAHQELAGRAELVGRP